MDSLSFSSKRNSDGTFTITYKATGEVETFTSMPAYLEKQGKLIKADLAAARKQRQETPAEPLYFRQDGTPVYRRPKLRRA